MKTRSAAAVLVFCATAGAAGIPAAGQDAKTENHASGDRATLDRYCITCHNARLRTGGLALDIADPANVGGSSEVWEKVVRKVRAGMMPPPGRTAPSAEDRR